MLKRQRCDFRARKRCHPDRHGRIGLVLFVIGQHTLGSRADQAVGVDQVTQVFKRRPNCLAVGRRDKHHCQIWPPSSKLGDCGESRLTDRPVQLVPRGRRRAAVDAGQPLGGV